MFERQYLTTKPIEWNNLSWIVLISASIVDRITFGQELQVVKDWKIKFQIIYLKILAFNQNRLTFEETLSRDESNDVLKLSIALTSLTIKQLSVLSWLKCIRNCCKFSLMKWVPKYKDSPRIWRFKCHKHS